MSWLPSSSHKTTWCLNKDSQVGWQNTGSLKQMLKANKSKINKPSHARPGKARLLPAVSISFSKQPTGSNCGASSHSFQRHSRELREKPGNIKQQVFHLSPRFEVFLFPRQTMAFIQNGKSSIFINLEYLFEASGAWLTFLWILKTCNCTHFGIGAESVDGKPIKRHAKVRAVEVIFFSQEVFFLSPVLLATFFLVDVYPTGLADVHKINSQMRWLGGFWGPIRELSSALWVDLEKVKKSFLPNFSPPP